MPEQDQKNSASAMVSSDTARDGQAAAWTYDSWFAGWYTRAGESESGRRTEPSLADA